MTNPFLAHGVAKQRWSVLYARSALLSERVRVFETAKTKPCLELKSPKQRAGFTTEYFVI